MLCSDMYRSTVWLALTAGVLALLGSASCGDTTLGPQGVDGRIGPLSLAVSGPAVIEEELSFLVGYEASADVGVERLLFDWGDGSPPETVPGAGRTFLRGSVSHAFTEPGEYRVEVVAVDGRGRTVSAARNIRAARIVPASATVAFLERGQRFQTMEGWGFSLPSAASMEQGLNPLATFPFRPGEEDTLYRLLFDPSTGLGMTHMGVFAGWDLEGFWSGKVRDTYEDTNDNDDPFVIDWTGFDLSPDWPNWKVMRKAAARGAVLIHKGTVPEWTKDGNSFRVGMEAEFAEHLVAYLLFARDVMDIRIPLLIPRNEPNTGPARFTDESFAGAVRAVAEMLAFRGLDVRLVAPETNAVSAGLSFSEALLADPVVRSRLAAIAVHPYGGDQASTWSSLASLARSNGLPVWQGEFSTAGKTGGLDFTVDDGLQLALDIRRHLVNGDVALWFNLLGVGCLCGEHGGAEASLIIFNPGGGGAFSIELPPRYHTFGQFSKYVRPGAVRIGITASGSGLAPIAFETPAGGIVVVLINRGASESTLRLEGLGGITNMLRTRTSEGENGIRISEHSVEGGLTLLLPARSVTTLTSDPP